MSVPAGGSAEFALAENGTLLYAPGRSKMADRQLVRVDRRGVGGPLLDAPRAVATFRLSPDGRLVAAHLRGGIDGILLFDIARGGSTRLTAEWDNISPIWDPTSRQIIFSSARQSAYDLYRQSIAGDSAATRIVTNEFTKLATSWSPDGAAIAYEEQGDIQILRFDPGSKPTAFLTSRAREQSAAFSPNGAWLAYVSDESGRDEVYVRRFPDAGGRRLVSIDGGTSPVWSPDGTELFYRNGPRMMTVAVQDLRTMVVARPRLLYERRFGRSNDDHFSVTPDGRYFVDLDDSVAEPPPTELVVVQNFGAELRRLASPGR
jgi:Tol biopolymer transport system component